jgi:hypothetical protein
MRIPDTLLPSGGQVVAMRWPCFAAGVFIANRLPLNELGANAFAAKRFFFL